jgi:hypothetical protein
MPGCREGHAPEGSRVVSEPVNERVLRAVENEPATLDDLVTELRRIADALTGTKCYGVQDGAACVLAPRHVGHHTTADGRSHWLDEE